MSEGSVLRPLLNKLESAHLEHIGLDAPLERTPTTVCAFLNTGGGTAIVELGSVAATARQKKARIESELHSQIIPSALWSATLEEVAGEFYCLVDVPAGRDRPYMVNGTIYIRHGAASVIPPPGEIKALIESSYAESDRWERKLIPGAGVDRLDERLVRTTAEEASKRRNSAFAASSAVVSILTELSMYRQHAITHAAEVVFGLRPAVQFPQVRARVTVYGADKAGVFVDNRQFEKAALMMLEDVFAMVRQHTPVTSTFPAGLQRSDQAAYPEAAVREGLINAFVHRDYANFSGGISVDLYPTRLVIWNSGSLPSGIKIGDLKREHPSMPRNPDIAQVFFLRGLMERVGRGTQKIVSAFEEAGLPPPEWKVDETGVTLTFHSGRAPRARLNLRERKLLDLLKAGETIQVRDYMERLAVSERQARRDLGNLSRNGWLEREGQGPSTVYRRTRQELDSAKSGHNS